MLAPEDLLSNDVDQLRLLIAERRDEERNQERSAKADKGSKGSGKPEKGGRKTGGGGSATVERSGPMPMEHDGIDVSPSCISTLTGHDSEVYVCSWSPSEPLLASG